MCVQYHKIFAYKTKIYMVVVRNNTVNRDVASTIEPGRSFRLFRYYRSSNDDDLEHMPLFEGLLALYEYGEIMGPLISKILLKKAVRTGYDYYLKIMPL